MKYNWQKLVGPTGRTTKSDLIRKMWKADKAEGMPGLSDRIYEFAISDALQAREIVFNDNGYLEVKK